VNSAGWMAYAAFTLFYYNQRYIDIEYPSVTGRVIQCYYMKLMGYSFKPKG